MTPVTKAANITQQQAKRAVRAYLRNKPYTEIGIRRIPCLRCGNPSRFQWNICSLPGFHAICLDCDVALNRAVLDFMGVEDAQAIGDKYEREKRA